MKNSKENLNHWPITIMGILASMASLLLPLFLVRTLPIESIGQYKIFFLYIMIIPSLTMTLGLLNGLAYWAGDSDSREKNFKATFSITYATGFLALIFVYFLSPLFLGKLGLGGISAELFSLAVFAAIVVPFFDEAAITTGRIWFGSLFHTGAELFRMSVILLSAYYFQSLESVLIAHVAVMLLRALVGFLIGVKLDFVGLAFDKVSMKSVLSYSTPVSLAFVFGVIVQHSDQILLSSHLSESEFAFYSIGCLMLPPLLILEHSVTRVLIPKLSSYFRDNRKSDAAEIFSDAIAQLAWVLIPVSIALIVYASPIVEILFTEKYMKSASYLAVYAVSYIFLVFPYDSIPRSTGQSSWILKNFIVFSVLSLAFSYFGIVLSGAMGALIGILISKALMRFYGMWWISKAYSWKFGDFIPLRKISLFLVSSGICAGFAILFKGLFESHVLWFLLTSPILLFIYLLANHKLFKHIAASKKIRKPSVLMLTQHLGMGGLEKMILNLSVTLKNSGDSDIVVVSYDHELGTGYPDLIDDFKREGIPVDTFHKSSGFSIKAVKRIMDSCKKFRVNVIHTHDLGALIYGVFVKLFMLGEVRLVHTQHSFIHFKKDMKRYKLYQKFFTLFIDELTVVSEDTKRVYSDLGVDESKIITIPNGVSFINAETSGMDSKMEYRNHILSSAKDFVTQHDPEKLKNLYWMICIGRVADLKGQRHLIELWKYISEKSRKKMALFIVGPEVIQGEFSILKSKISDSCDPEHVVLAGPTHEPHKWLHASDLFLSASEFEGMPLSSLEAIGSGIPTVLSEIPGHEMLKQYSRQFPLDNLALGAKQLEAHLNEHLTEEARKLSESRWKNSEILRKRFSLEAMAQKYSSIYKGRITWG